MSFPRRIPHLSCSTRSATVDAPRLESPPSYWFRKWFVALEKKNELSLLKVSSRRTEYAHPVCCSNGFPGMSSNDRAILFLMIILEKTVSTVKSNTTVAWSSQVNICGNEENGTERRPGKSSKLDNFLFDEQLFHRPTWIKQPERCQTPFHFPGLVHDISLARERDSEKG